MKTLKKSLCLIMALVFVLGLCTFGAGAAFTDDADINYGDAVAVMQGLGILKGYEDGSFQPAKGVTRAEAATMITKMILGEAAAAKLPAASAFADVPADGWAAPFVNYCASKKIIVGYGDGNFGPDDPVTALQMAKMLLVACGYGEMGEFGPDVWEINTFTYAVEEGIFNVVDVADFSLAATREECAQYVFNALKVGQVKYDVDMNAYDAKTYEDENGKKHEVTYGYKTFKLEKCEGMVMENQATGADYTVIAPLNDTVEFTGFKNSKMNFNCETDASYIGHKVVVYYKAVERTDADKVKFFDAYLASDVSTVYDVSVNFVSKSLGALAKEMGYPESNLSYVKGFFNSAVNPYVPYAPKDVNFTKSGVYNLGRDVGVKNLTAGGDTTVEKANGSKDAATSYIGNWSNLVMDDEGNVISALTTTWTYAKVVEIDEDENYVEIDFGNGFSKNEKIALDTVYPGVAEGDIVTVMTTGKLYSLIPTSTQVVTVSDLVSTKYSTTVNGTINADPFAPTAWTPAFVDDEDGDFKGFSVAAKLGDTIKVYKNFMNMAFGAVVLDTATSSYVYVTKFYQIDNTLSYGDKVTSYMAQAVDAEGNEVNLLVGRSDFNGTAGVYDLDSDADPKTLEPTQNGTKELEEGLYKVTDTLFPGTKTAYVELSQGSEILKIAGDEYKGTETHITDAHHYLTSATNYLYIKGDGTTLKVKKGVALTGDKVEAYYVKDSDEAFNISTIWIKSAEAPVYNSDYLFVFDTDSGKAEKSYSGSILVDGNTYMYYSAYVNGVKTSNIVDVNNVGKGKLGGFYEYSIDANGYYELSSVKGDSVTFTKNDVYRGELIKKSVGNNAIAVVLGDYDILDLTSGYQDKKGFNNAITDADSLSAALEAGYSVTLQFVYDAAIAKAPVGTLYITGCAK